VTILKATQIAKKFSRPVYLPHLESVINMSEVAEGQKRLELSGLGD